jgi:hypothetical protein
VNNNIVINIMQSLRWSGESEESTVVLLLAFLFIMTLSNKVPALNFLFCSMWG